MTRETAESHVILQAAMYKFKAQPNLPKMIKGSMYTLSKNTTIIKLLVKLYKIEKVLKRFLIKGAAHFFIQL